MKRIIGAVAVSLAAINGIFIGGLATVGGQLYPTIGELEMVVGFAIITAIPVFLYTWFVDIQPAAIFVAFIGSLLTTGLVLYLLGYIDDSAPIAVIGFLLFLAGGAAWISAEIWVENPPSSKQ